MLPLHELLSRIRWDAEFARGEFRIGYFDRILGRLVYLPLAEIHPEQDSHFNFEITDEDGVRHSIPYHRIKEVWKNGELIWHREH